MNIFHLGVLGGGGGETKNGFIQLPELKTVYH